MAASATYDALFVVAAGNDSFDTASSPADLPLLYPEYESRWMAVVAANVENGVVVGLDDYSNQCGLAMNWCIAAPATNRMTASDSEPGANYVAGTSLATPFVSGVAALVKENFGWMTASNLQTTIFTTAVDMGDAGVDEVWGWGVVDAYGALKDRASFWPTSLQTWMATTTPSSRTTSPAAVVW
jgi:Subtilisin-like serine proteases